MLSNWLNKNQDAANATSGARKFEVYEESRQGARHNNQDKAGHYCTEESCLLVVCDGMGGHLRGDIASQFVVDFILKSFRQAATPRVKDPAQFLVKVILGAHHALIKFAGAHKLPETPRTTCVMALIQDGKVCWAHVGDSRLYMVRQGQVAERTLDHSHVQSMIDSGKISEEEALVHPDRNKIFNCIGQQTLPRIDVRRPVAMRKGDMLLLCSDGLWGPMPNMTLSTVMSRCGLEVSIPMLLDLSEAVSGKECDNLTALAFVWLGDEVLPRDQLPQTESYINDDDIEVAVELLRGAILHRVPGFAS